MSTKGSFLREADNYECWVTMKWAIIFALGFGIIAFFDPTPYSGNYDMRTIMTMLAVVSTLMATSNGFRLLYRYTQQRTKQ